VTQTIENIRLSSDEYRNLEEIAQSKGVDPSAVVGNWITENIIQYRLETLRKEYRDLIQKDLHRTITEAERSSLEKVIGEVNALEMQTVAYKHWERSVEAIDRQFEELEQRINALPNREG